MTKSEKILICKVIVMLRVLQKETKSRLNRDEIDRLIDELEKSL